MEDPTTGQVTESAARVYERFFVPALFGQWPEQVLQLAGVTRGMRVLDVACGTGVLARAALHRVGASGAVTGLDLNPGMLDVARGATSAVTWVLGDAEGMPFEDAAFDAVVSQFALMFFADRDRALREMSRVARAGAPVAVVTWAGLDSTPGYAAMVALLDELFGSPRADALRAPFTLGTPELLRDAVSPTSRTWTCDASRAGRGSTPWMPGSTPTSAAGRSRTRSATRSTTSSCGARSASWRSSSATTQRWTSPLRRCWPSVGPADATRSRRG